MLHGKDDKSDKPKFEVDGFEVGGTEEEPKGEEAANIAFKAMGGGTDIKEKSKFEALKIDPLVAWDGELDVSPHRQLIIPNINSVSDIDHYQNESKEDRFRFAIEYNGFERWYTYGDKEKAYTKYNELIDKISEFHKKVK